MYSYDSIFDDSFLTELNKNNTNDENNGDVVDVEIDAQNMKDIPDFDSWLNSEDSLAQAPIPGRPPNPRPDHRPSPQPPRPDHRPSPQPPRPSPQPPRPDHRPAPPPPKHDHRPQPPYGPGRPPQGPPPTYTPKKSPELYRVDPGTIRGCKGEYTYVWLRDGRSFWIYIVNIGRTSLSGFRWTNFGWVYFGLDLRNIESFYCIP